MTDGASGFHSPAFAGRIPDYLVFTEEEGVKMWEVGLAFLLGALSMWIVWGVDLVKKSDRRDIDPEDVPDVVPANKEERF